MASEIKDKILYLRLKQKDKEAFIKAYDLYVDDIYRFVYFKVRNNKEEAEDIVSAVFLKAWKHIQDNSITEFKTLRALFYKVAGNLVIDHYRKKSTQLNTNLDETIDIHDEAQDLQREIEVASDFQGLEAEMLKLKDEYREVITLRYINELSIKEIADILGKKSGNIRVLVYRATKALKELVNKDTIK